MTYRIGIVGAGFLTRFALVTAIRDTPGARLVAVLDPDPEALAALAAGCPGVGLTRDEDEFFDTPMDAVHIATPNYLHEHFAGRALAQGVAVCVEKPVAHTVASAERIFAQAGTSAVPAIVGYMSKHNVYNQEARRLVAAGAIGTPRTMVAARLGWRKTDWRSQRRASGLGCLADLGIYPVLTAVDIFGAEPVRCQAAAWPAGDPDRTDLYAQATLWFDEHRYLHFETAATFHEQPASAEVSSYTVVGDAGLLQVSGAWQMDGTGRLDLCDAAGWRAPAALTPVGPYRRQYELLMMCSAGAPVPAEVGIERAVRDLRILYAVADSAATGSRVTTLDLDATALSPVGGD